LDNFVADFDDVARVYDGAEIFDGSSVNADAALEDNGFNVRREPRPAAAR